MRNFIYERRKEAGFTQKQVSEKCGISQGYYSMIENGERGKLIPFKTAKKIADVLEFPVERFNQPK